MSVLVDEHTGDFFEPENAIVVEVDVDDVTGSRLYLPKRARAITTVKTRDRDGVLTVELAADYRLRSSLDAAGTSKIGVSDWLEVIPGHVLSTGSKAWPQGPQTVQLTGNFSWGATPEAIKRAVALLVYDHIKPVADKMRRATGVRTKDADYELSRTEPTGIPEVDQTIAEYQRLYI